MGGSVRQRRGLFLVLVLAFGLAFAGAAWAAGSGADQAEIIRHDNTSYQTQSPDEVWTLERIRQAKPMPQPGFVAAPPASHLQEAPLPSQEIILPPMSPAMPSPAAGPGPEASGYQAAGYTDCPPSGYSYGVVEAQEYWPLKTTGKLVTVLNGQDWACSAAVVGPGLILTAAHCVYDGGWATDMAFIPALDISDENPMPFGVWAWDGILTFSGWTSFGLFPYDVAFIKLKPQNGTAIHEHTGHLGLVFGGDPSSRAWLQLGYPVLEFEGYRMIFNLSAYGTRDYRFNDTGLPVPVGVGSGLTGGASGGPWIVEKDGGYYANGLNSYLPPWCNPGTVFSPYFGMEAYRLALAALDM